VPVDTEPDGFAAGTRRPRPRRRDLLGAAVGSAGLVGLTLALLPSRDRLSLAGVTLLYLVPVLAAAVTGGLWPALAGALAADLLVNFFFVPPYHTLVVDSPGNVLVLVVYILVAATVAVAVDVAARQRATAIRRSLESRLLARISSAPVAAGSLTDLLEQVLRSYGLTTVALLDGERVLARVGAEPAGPPSLRVATGATGSTLAGWGPETFAEDRGTLGRLAAAAVRIRENQHLADEAATARELAGIDRLRAALLNAVGHDLRTPLAGIKAAVSSLRQPDVTFTEPDRAELLATIEQSTDLLSGLVENLLSLSRLQAGALSVDARPVPLDAVVAQALLHTPGGAAVAVDVPDDLPPALADPDHRPGRRRRAGAPDHRPRAGPARRTPGPGLRPVPAAARPRHRPGSRPGHRARVYRSHGRHPRPGRHPGWRTDHDHHPAGGAPVTPDPV
jgi:K+-sensing histidine kinase KdpD